MVEPRMTTHADRIEAAIRGATNAVRPSGWSSAEWQAYLAGRDDQRELDVAAVLAALTPEPVAGGREERCRCIAAGEGGEHYPSDHARLAARAVPVPTETEDCGVCHQRRATGYVMACAGCLPTLGAVPAETDGAWAAFTSALGYGDNRTEPAATPEQLLPILKRAIAAEHEHIECERRAEAEACAEGECDLGPACDHRESPYWPRRPAETDGLAEIRTLEARWSDALDTGCPSCGPTADCDHIEGYHYALSDLRALLDVAAPACADCDLTEPEHNPNDHPFTPTGA